MGVYSVRGFTAATAASADQVVCALWNPASAQRIKVLEFGFYKTGILSKNPNIVNITTRGTPGSTVTPDADNGWDASDIPPSGALLDLAAYSVQPTLGSPRLGGAYHTGLTGGEASGYVWVFADGLMVPPGKGFALLSRDASCSASEVYYVWEEQ
jgi:hypothetical protein